MIKPSDFNQFTEAGGMKPNKLTQTDLCDDGVMKTIEINQLNLSVDDEVIKGNKLCQSGPYDSEGTNNKINQADQLIKGSEVTQSHSCNLGGEFKV